MNLGLLQEQQELLTVELSLYTSLSVLLFWSKWKLFKNFSAIYFFSDVIEAKASQ